MAKDFMPSMMDTYNGIPFLEEFSVDFEVLERIAHKQSEETLLVKSRANGSLCIAKCYMHTATSNRSNEAQILKTLSHPGLPKYIAEYENDHVLCVVREYSDGLSLDRYAAENKLSQQDIVSIGQQLCDVLAYLHSATPPVIHRDIKPQNIIIDSDKRIKLIDFGISRTYDAQAEEDTTALGTKYFAAPEQYGFSQTDCRADIFSLGVLLGWLYTGELKLKNILEKIKDTRIKHIIKKCTAFSPKNRYSSALKAKRALSSAGRQKRMMNLCALFIVAAVFLFVGFAVGRFSDWFETTPNGVQFTEPLIEEAVRVMLDIPNEQHISENDLLSMTEIFIYGDKVADGHDTFGQLGTHMAANDGYLRNGGITSLEDLTMMKNLRSVNIVLQDFYDIAPLAQLPALSYVDLRHNPVEDLSPLAQTQSLQTLCIYDTFVSDISALKDCPQLNSISAGKTRISNLSGFGGIAALKHLDLVDVPLKTLDGIEDYSNLERLTISSVLDNDLQPLLALPQLLEVCLSENLINQADDHLDQAPFIISVSSQ